MPLEELLLRHALGESTTGWVREPIRVGRDDDSDSAPRLLPRRRRASKRRERWRTSTTCVMTAKPEQLLVPLPEGASYLGFIFARAGAPTDVDRALRDAHARLEFTIDPDCGVQLTNG